MRILIRDIHRVIPVEFTLLEIALFSIYLNFEFL